MNSENTYFSEIKQDCKLYALVEIDKLKAVFKARKFRIQVSESMVQSGLIPSIFDWSLVDQLLLAEQAYGELMLQQRINNLEQLNELTTSLQRIQIQPEIGLRVDVLMGRPSYNVLVQEDGSISVQELPSLHIHVYECDYLPTADQDGGIRLIEAANRLVTNKATQTRSQDIHANGNSKTLCKVEARVERSPRISPNLCNRSRVQPYPKLDEHGWFDVDDMELEQDLEAPSPPPLPSEASLHRQGNRLRRRQTFWSRFRNWLCHKFYH